MPLKCLRGEEEIYAFDTESDEAWESLREGNAAARDLRMPCCGAGVVLRTSKLGTRHFAHSRRGPCETAPETAEHLLAKMAVVEGVKATAWAALPEQTGRTPAGEEWRADVLAEKGKARVAFEIQWSRQDGDETDRRQRRYAEAGVRGLWLFRQKDFPTRKEIPSFRLVFDGEAKTFDVLLPSLHYDPRWAGNEKDDAISSHGTRGYPCENSLLGRWRGGCISLPPSACGCPSRCRRRGLDAGGARKRRGWLWG